MLLSKRDLRRLDQWVLCPITVWVRAVLISCLLTLLLGVTGAQREHTRTAGPQEVVVALIILITVGVIAYRGATSIFGAVAKNESARLTVLLSRIPGALAFLQFYVIVGIPLAFANGYLLRLSWIDCLIVGISTWVGTLAAGFFGGRLVAIPQFLLFSVATLVWLIVDAARLLL